MELTIHKQSKWIGWIVATILAAAAAYAYFASMSHGMAAGAWIGLPGRESDIAFAQRMAMKWFYLSLLLQAGVALAIFSVLRFGQEASIAVRIGSRAIVAAALSLACTLGMAVLMFVAARVLLGHSR